MAERFTGTVKWFNAQKGYGFIRTDDNKELFIHYTEIKGEGYKTLEEGQTVEFSISEGKKGPIASNLTLVEH